MAILNLPTFIEQEEKTPEQKMLESLQQMQIERPQAEVPRFTRYGNRMAERGGFDVLPQEQLRGMTQQQVDEYEAERRKARGAGISETLMRVGQAFAGRDASGLALQREQARRQAGMQFRLDAAIDQMNIPEAQKSLIKSLTPQQQYAALYGAEKATKGPSSYEEYIRTDSTPTEAEYLAFLRDKEKAKATVIQMGKGEEEYIKSLARLGEEDIKTSREIATTSRELLPRLQSAQILLQNPDFETGPVTSVSLPLRRLFNDITGQDQTDVSGQELFQALANYTVPRMRPPGSGATSDFEANLFASSTIQLGNTKEGNELTLATMIQQAEREQELLRLKEKYFRENKGDTVGFNDYLFKNNLVPPLYQQINLNKQNIGDLYDSGQIKNGEAYVDMTDPVNPRLTIFRLSDFE